MSDRGTGAAPDTGPAGAPPAAGTSLGRRLVGGVVTFGVVIAIFAFLVPKLSGVTLGEAAASITAAGLAVTLLAGLVNLTTNWPPIVVSLPGLRVPQAGVANLTSSAVSNTVPEGGAVATGLTYAIFHSWGFGVRPVTVSILTTGVWTNLVRYSLFAVSLLVVALGTAQAARWLSVAAIVVVAMAGVVVVFVLGLRSETFTVRLGHLVERVVHPAQRLVRRGPSDLTGALVRFRSDLVGLVTDRWGRLTAWMALSQVTMALVLVVALRAAGIGADEVGVALAFVAYTGASLAALVIPTPGGLGVVEAAYLAILTPFVPADQQAQLLAAIVMFRAATWLLPIPLGAGTYLFWRLNRSWRVTPAAATT
ncbi:MAG: lysylphosphatidylglycerol synthase domain-containing protein [Acidimicrobiales bacterium]